MPVFTAASAGTEHGAIIPIGKYVSDGTSAGTTFTSIPQGYQDLMLVVSGRGTRVVNNDHILIAVNVDTSSNYSYTYLTTDGSTASSARATAQGFGVMFSCLAGLNSTPGVFGSGVTFIPNYASTSTYKTILSKSGVDNNGNGQLTYGVNLYKANTNAVTSLYCVTYTNLVAGSTITLYGIRSVGQ
jgi:hypothetical protein